jgi:pimeloyl-ACP methyl ester carboxylesterase
MWRGFPQRIAVTTGCSALVYSRYGNGFSDVLTGPRTVSYMHDEARALPEILDRYEIAEAILVGHSDGASIALIYAGENGARVRAIVAEAPHVFVEDRSIEGIVRAKAEYERGGLRAKLSRYHRDVDRTFYGWNDVWLSTGFRIWNIRGAVRNVRVPMLLVQGRDDEYGTREQLHAICEDARGPVDVLYLAHCGHSPHRSRAELVTAAVSSFIAETLE